MSSWALSFAYIVSVAYDLNLFGAFAVYYALQCAIAALAARQRGDMARGAGFFVLAVLAFAIAVFGQVVEG